VVGHDYGRAAPPQDPGGENAHSGHNGRAVDQKDAVLNDAQAMSRLLSDQQVLLDERAPIRVTNSETESTLPPKSRLFRVDTLKRDFTASGGADRGSLPATIVRHLSPRPAR
jgi:hypothetical protein